jgi:hypothetical protein
VPDPTKNRIKVAATDKIAGLRRGGIQNRGLAPWRPRPGWRQRPKPRGSRGGGLDLGGGGSQNRGTAAAAEIAGLARWRSGPGRRWQILMASRGGSSNQCLVLSLQLQAGEVCGGERPEVHISAATENSYRGKGWKSGWGIEER